MEQWEYMHLDFDGRPNPDLSPIEKAKAAYGLSKVEVFLWMPDGSLRVINLENGNIGYQQEILKIVNELGKNGWEAFDRKTTILEEHWTLKRKIKKEA